jgi:peptidoglycan hydrolase CwlO-like protein
MEEQLTELSSTAARLATAAEALQNILERLDAQQAALTAKVDRIVAAIDERASNPAAEIEALRSRTAQLEHENAELKAQAAPAARKTLPPLVTSLLSKSCGVPDAESPRLDAATLDKTLGSLSLEQRIAVKAEMARAGMIE